jgi:predicted MPP superfamily phosphohydrolase
MALATAGAVLGAATLVLDLGNRLFGSHRRTGAGFTWRLGAVLGSVGLLLAPAGALAWEPGSTVWRVLSGAAGVVGAVAFVHFLLPYRWGIRRVRRDGVQESCRELTPGILLREVSLRIPSLPAGLDGLEVLVISDVHCRSRRKLGLLRECCAALRPRGADLVLLLGDFGGKSELLAETIELLAAIPARLGTFCVLGNHDLEGAREATIRDLLGRHAVHVLPNAWARFPDRGLALVGLETPWRQPPPAPCEARLFAVGLAHTPDNLALLERLNVGLAVAGHTHGGRARLPVVGPVLVPTLYGRFLDRGLFRRGRTLLYVSAGLGYFCPSPRNRGELTRLVLRRAEGAPA